MKRDPDKNKKKKLSLSADKVRELKSADQLAQVAGGGYFQPFPCGLSYRA